MTIQQRVSRGLIAASIGNSASIVVIVVYLIRHR